MNLGFPMNLDSPAASNSTADAYPYHVQTIPWTPRTASNSTPGLDYVYLGLALWWSAMLGWSIFSYFWALDYVKSGSMAGQGRKLGAFFLSTWACFGCLFIACIEAMLTGQNIRSFRKEQTMWPAVGYIAGGISYAVSGCAWVFGAELVGSAVTALLNNLTLAAVCFVCWLMGYETYGSLEIAGIIVTTIGAVAFGLAQLVDDGEEKKEDKSIGEKSLGLIIVLFGVTAVGVQPLIQKKWMTRGGLTVQTWVWNIITSVVFLSISVLGMMARHLLGGEILWDSIDNLPFLGQNPWPMHLRSGSDSPTIYSVALMFLFVNNFLYNTAFIKMCNDYSAALAEMVKLAASGLPWLWNNYLDPLKKIYEFGANIVMLVGIFLYVAGMGR